MIFFRSALFSKNPDFSQNRLFRSRRRLGDHLGRLGVTFGPLGRPSWPSEASLGSLGAVPGRPRDAPGAPRERSWEAAWRSCDALGTTRGFPTSPGTDFGKIPDRVGSRFGWVW